MDYIFIDPINKPYSGISSYINIASKLLSNLANIYIIKREKSEDIDSFRYRVKKEVEEKFSIDNTIVESPDTYGATLLLDRDWTIHIRLHGLKNVFDLIEGNEIDIKLYRESVNAMLKAYYISSPSNIIYNLEKKDINFSNIYIYPNPIEQYKNKTDKDIDILFIGRNQKIKGIKYLKIIVKEFKEKRIVFYGKGLVKLKNKNLLVIDNKDNNYKEKLLERAKVVIIPSIIESFSQVAGEAISNNAGVVCWDKVGISEYNLKTILVSKFNNIQDFINNIKIQLENDKNCEDFYDDCHKINSMYIKYMSCILKRTLKPNNIFSFNKNLTIRSVYMGKFIKKTKKLFRNPKQYWNDSISKRYLDKLMRRHNDKDHKEYEQTNKVSIINQGQKFNKIKSINKYSSIDKNRVINNYFGIDQNIKINNFSISNKPGNTLFFFKEHDEENRKISKLLSDCDRNSLFINFRDGYVFKFFYRENENLNSCDVPSFYKTFSSDFVDAINKFQYLIFINPTSFLYRFIRGRTSKSHIIVILTSEKYITQYIDNQFIDTLFLNFDERKLENYLQFRNIVTFDTYDKVIESLNKFFIENSQKHYDMFLTLFGNHDYMDNISELCSSQTECIIKFDNENIIPNQHCACYNDFLMALSPHIKLILVRESVFFRYKSLIFRCKESLNWQSFLEKISYDGIRIHVL